jgi:hypothetical protein
MLLEKVLPFFQASFTGGVAEDLEKYFSEPIVFRTGKGRFRQLNKGRRRIQKKIKQLEDAVKKTAEALWYLYWAAFLLSLFVSYFLTFGSVIGTAIGGATAYMAIKLCVMHDKAVAKRISDDTTEEVRGVVEDQLADVAEGALDAFLTSDVAKQYCGFLGNFEAGGDGVDQFVPTQGALMLLRGLMLIMSVTDAEGRASSFLRYLDIGKNLSNDAAKLVMNATSVSRFGLGRKKSAISRFFTWSSQSEDGAAEEEARQKLERELAEWETNPNFICSPETISYLRGNAPFTKFQTYRQKFARGLRAPSALKQTVTHVSRNPAPYVGTAVMGALAGYGTYKFRNGSGFNRPRPLRWAGGKKEAKKESPVPDTKGEPEASKEVNQATEAAMNAAANSVVEDILTELETKEVPEPSPVVDERISAWKQFLGMGKSKGEQEAAKVGQTTKNGLLKSHKRTEKGGHIWAYEDVDSGKKILAFVNEDGDLYSGDPDYVRSYMKQKWDDYEQDDDFELYDDHSKDDKQWKEEMDEQINEHIFGNAYESGPPTTPVVRLYTREQGWLKTKASVTKTKSAKKKEKKKAKANASVAVEPQGKTEASVEVITPPVAVNSENEVGNMESSLGGCAVDLAKIQLLILRKKSDHGVYQNVPILSGKAIAYKHTMGSAKIDEFEFVDQKGKVTPLESPIGSTVETEILYFKPPTGQKSILLRRGMLPPGTTEAPCAVVGFTGGFKAGDLPQVASGTCFPTRLRHTSPTKPGWCGSVVLVTKGDAPVVAGLHLYGDDGTGTNGYIPVTPALTEEMNRVTFPKN